MKRYKNKLEIKKNGKQLKIRKQVNDPWRFIICRMKINFKKAFAIPILTAI